METKESTFEKQCCPSVYDASPHPFVVRPLHWCCLLESRVKFVIKTMILGAWVTQSVKHLPSAQVMTPGVLGWSPASGSLLSGESASPSTPPLLMHQRAHALSLSQ